MTFQADVLIVGGGPAGIAAAVSAAECGRQIVIADDNPNLGGQVWRGEPKSDGAAEASLWLRKLRAAGMSVIPGARIFDQPEPGLLLAETSNGPVELPFGSLIVATGARERFLPFPGWTLPNVYGAGGLQALVKSGMPIDAKRVVVAGSGPLLPAVAAYLKQNGAHVALIAEQAPRSRLLRFGLTMLGLPEKIRQALILRRQISGIPYLTSCWPVAALGSGVLSGVRMRRGGKTWDEACDYLACGFHLVPNFELAELLGCECRTGIVRVNEYQETSLSGIYCAGETTGIGGLELSLVEGKIAGCAASGAHGRARLLFGERARRQRFARSLERTFALREELRALPRPDTLVCRCEDVSFGRMRAYHSWRAAKLQTRIGMGPCQGRVCGSASEFLLGWGVESVRPPIFPARLESLAHKGENGPSRLCR